MDYKNYLQTPQKSKLMGGLLLLLYLINDHILRRSALETKLWEALRLELYFLGGQCQHTGQCCKNLMIYKKEKPINTISAFESLKKQEPVYERFIPHKTDDQIKRYSCNCLTPQNWCRDYENRPTICRNYPLSNFLRGDSLYSGCGYRIQKSNFPFKIRNKNLLKRMSTYDAFYTGKTSLETHQR